jgi:hypothetical protein
MSALGDGGPAFPTHGGADWHKDSLDPTKDDPRNMILGGGMSLRDWFAGQALAGMLAQIGKPMKSSMSYIARDAYEIADAALAARGAKP